MPSTSHPSTPFMKSLLLSGLNGDLSAIEALYSQSYPYYRRLAHRLAGSLAPDLLDEAVDEMWLRVIAAGPEPFLKSGVGEAAYLTGVLRNAVRAVRAANRPPGSPSRGSWVPSAEYFDAIPTEATDARFDDSSELEDARIEIGLLLLRASPKVREAAILMLTDDLSLSAAAERVGIGRMTFTRALKALGNAA